MKGIVLSSIMIVLAITPFSCIKAQKLFSLSELQSLCQKSSNEFEIAVLKAGYSLYSSTDTEKRYTCDIKNPNGIPNFIVQSRNPYPGGVFVLVRYNTTSKQYYLDLKAVRLTKANGWTFVEEENVDIDGTPSIWYHYTNGKFHVILYSATYDIGQPTWYTVQTYLEP